MTPPVPENMDILITTLVFSFILFYFSFLGIKLGIKYANRTRRKKNFLKLVKIEDKKDKKNYVQVEAFNQDGGITLVSIREKSTNNPISWKFI